MDGLMAQKPLSLTRAPDPQPQSPDLATTLASIAARLEAAANVRISHMDSDNRVAAINEQRTTTMRQIAAELRALT